MPAGRALLAWFGQPACDGVSPGATRSLVDIRQATCQRVPGGANAGYRVTCNEDGTGGVYDVCRDEGCT